MLYEAAYPFKPTYFQKALWLQIIQKIQQVNTLNFPWNGKLTIIVLQTAQKRKNTFSEESTNR